MIRLVVLLLLLLTGLVARAADRPPNIIFILADDLGYGELGCYGQKLMSTPSLDRMAAQGLRFTQFYAGSPVCAPSRAVLMTGLHTGHARVRGNAGKDNREAQSLRQGDVTVAETLKQAGYATALIGKWGLAQEGGEGVPNRKGFDYFYGYLDQTHAHNPYTPFVFRNEERLPLRNKLIASTDKGDGAGVAEEAIDYVPDLMTAEALKWIDQQKEKPFFLFWSLITPHANNEGKKMDRAQEVPDLGAYRERSWPEPDKAHAATISRLDADVGRLLDHLKALGLEEKTLVIFTSDNGHHAEGGHDPDRIDANGPLQGKKRDLFEGGIRVPMIAYWPGTIPPNWIQGGAYWFADFYQAFVSLAGVGTTAGSLDGESSLAPLLRGTKVKRVVRPVLYWEFHEDGFSQAVLMDERWKAIRLGTLDAPVTLFDLDSDLGETRDVAAEHPELIERARRYFASERTDSIDWPIKPKKPKEPAKDL